MYICTYTYIIYICIYIFIYVYIYMTICLYIYISIYLYIYIFICIYIYISIYLYTYVSIYIYSYMYVSISISVFVYIYIYIYRCVYVSSPISYLPILLGIFIEDPSPGQASLHAAISKEARSGEFWQILTGRQGHQLRLCGFLKMCMRIFWAMNLARSTRHEDAPNQKNWCPTRKDDVTSILHNDHLAHFGWVCHGCRSSCLRTRFKA